MGRPSWLPYIDGYGDGRDVGSLPLHIDIGIQLDYGYGMMWRSRLSCS